MCKTLHIHEAKTHLSRLLERVSEGEEIVISKAGGPGWSLLERGLSGVSLEARRGG